MTEYITVSVNDIFLTVTEIIELIIGLVVMYIGRPTGNPEDRTRRGILWFVGSLIVAITLGMMFSGFIYL